MMAPVILENLKEIYAFCKARGVRERSVSGSAVRNDFHTDSDIDFIAEFIRPSNPDDLQQLNAFYEDMDHLQTQLVRIVSRKVDLIQARGIKNTQLSALVRDKKEILYAAA